MRGVRGAPLAVQAMGWGSRSPGFRATAQKLTFSVFRCSIYVKALFSLSFRFSLVDLFYANNPPDRTRPRDDEPDYAVIHLSGELKTDASA